MRILTLIVTAGLLVSLTACSGSTTDSSADCTATPSGSVSDSIKVTGSFLKEPKVDFATPLAAPKTTERTVVIKGDGDQVVAGDTVNVLFSLYSGANSADIAGTDWSKGTTTELPVDAAQFLPGIVKTLECAKVGSRVVGVIPPADAFGEAGSPDLGVGAADSLVFVVDIKSIKPAAEPPLAKADGVDQPPVAGLPTVALSADGVPTVTIPDTPAPTDFQLGVLKKGKGAVVADGDSVVVNYQGLNWTTKEIFDDSWAKGTPATFSTSQVVKGFSQAIVGQSVGSQVVVVIPPALGYGEAGSSSNPLAGQTLVFVIDILGIA